MTKIEPYKGLKVGDEVAEKTPESENFNRTGTIVELDRLDTNRAYILTQQGQKLSVICNWCSKLKEDGHGRSYNRNPERGQGRSVH